MNATTQLARVKEVVDGIYELTQGSGYTGGLTRYGTNRNFSGDVLRAMIARGVVVCTTKAKARYPHYIWNDKALAPNRVFYDNILKDVQDIAAARLNKYRTSAPAPKTVPIPIEEILSPKLPAAKKAEEVIFVAEKPASLASFSDQQLWDELKSRGATIIDGKLKIVKVYELA